MFKNYLKTAWRHLKKNKLHSILHITGLAIALTSFILSILYYKDEHSFDTFHANNPYLYRINTTYIDNKTGQKHESGGTAQVQGPAFNAQLPEITAYTRIWGGDIIENVKSGDKAFNLGTAFVDSTFFNVFSFPLLHGNPTTALHDKYAAVITEKTALKFFGSTNVIGKRIEVADNPDSLFASFTVTGVAKDPPSNSSIQFDILLPFTYLKVLFNDDTWLNAYLGTFVVLHPATEIKALEKKFNAIHDANAGEQLRRAKENGEFDKQTYYTLQPFTEVYLNRLSSSILGRKDGTGHGSDIVYSYFLLGISFFILLMASINFINLSIGSSLKRAKEIGVRKITGGSKKQIIVQFLTESSIICLLSLLVAITLASVVLPFFNQLAGKHLSLSLLQDGSLFFYLGCLLIVNIAIAGLYPAFVLSGFKPKEVLYNKQTLSGHNWLGKGLVVFQFSLSVCLIISSIVYYRQMDFIRTKELGYNPSNIIRVEIPPRRDTRSIYNQFKNDLAKEPGIEQILFETNLYGDHKIAVNNKNVKSHIRMIDESYIPLLDIEMKEGRNFSKDFGMDKKGAAIVNEAFVRAAGLKDPVDAQIKTDNWIAKQPLSIVGVVKDYHYSSLKQAIQPMVFVMSDTSSGTVLLKINKARYAASLAAIEKVYKQVVPGSEYTYDFWDDLNAKEYKQELKWQKIIVIATALSILICCLGLFGLTNLSTRQRTKEIGIRKVLGASVASIASLLSKDLLKLVIIGFFIASPVAWWIMNNWLHDFPYRIDISWQVFLIGGMITVFIAIATVSFLAIKAAVANPVKSLRSE